MSKTVRTAVAKDEKFSLIAGGPLYQLLLRTHFVSPPTNLLYRRIVAGILITWVPLLLMSAAGGTLTSGVKVPFLTDLGSLRFLLMLPMLIAAEGIVHRRIQAVVEQFLERGLIASEDRVRFNEFVEKALRLRNSAAAEIILLAASYVAGHWAWVKFATLQVSTWYTTPSNALSLAGWWYVLVSLPLVRFIILRWYFRLVIWYLFLWRVSRLRLRLNSLHPDRAGGLGFLTQSIAGLTPVMVAQTVLLAIQIGNEILHAGAELPAFQFVIGGFVAFLLLMVLAPLAFFSIQLLEEKLRTSREYGRVASDYVQAFEQKWIHKTASADEALLGSADIQSLADLSNSFEVIRTMRLFPFDKRDVMRLIVCLALPFLPLVLSMISLSEMIKLLMQMLS